MDDYGYGKHVKRYRLVAVPQCSYSTVIQLRDWLPDAVGGVVWMAYDNPGQSPRIPIFCGTKDLPACFKVCGQHRYREDAAVWAFRRANKLATVRWGATKDRMKASIAHFTEKGQTELPFVESRYKEILTQQGEEAAKEYLTGYTADLERNGRLILDPIRKRLLITTSDSKDEARPVSTIII